MPNKETSVKVGKELIVDCHDIAFQSLYETIINNEYVDADDIDFFLQHLESLIGLLLENSDYKEKEKLKAYHDEKILDMVEGITSLERQESDYFEKALGFVEAASSDIYFICHPEKLSESTEYSGHRLFQLS